MDLSLSSLPSLSWVRQHLPIGPGVYIFKNSSGKVIYVGKAKNLKIRVNSYFRPPVTLGPKTTLLVRNINYLEYIEVESELEALLLESRLIKKFIPRFNIISKDDKSPYFIHITKEEFPRPIINHLSSGSIAGPFLNLYTPLRILKNIRRIAPYCLAHRPVIKPCFYYHLGLCNPCPGQDQKEIIKYQYMVNISRLKNLLRGHFRSVRLQLEKDMRQLASDQKYEKAIVYRDYLTSLNSLLSSPVTPEEYLVNPNLLADKRRSALMAIADIIRPFFPVNHLSRIEMIDIAHLSGTAASGALVVAVNGQLRPDLYRHFNIKSSPSESDVDMMKEIFSRRLQRDDWPFPQLLVLDGGIPQLSILRKINPGFPVIALSKQSETIIFPSEAGFAEINLPRDNPGLQLLQILRDEAHRFSRRLHHLRRSRNLTD